MYSVTNGVHTLQSIESRLKTCPEKIFVVILSPFRMLLTLSRINNTHTIPNSVHMNVIGQFVSQCL